MTYLTGTIKDIQQNPIQGAVVRVTLMNSGLDASGNVFIEDSSVTGMTDEWGYFSLQVWPNSESLLDAPYKFEVFGENGETLETYIIYIPNLASITLAEAKYLTEVLKTSGAYDLVENFKNLIPQYKLVQRTAYLGGNALVRVPLGMAYEVFAVETDAPARVRVYSTPQEALQDAGRSLGSSYFPSGLVMEGLTSVQTPKLLLNPVARGADLKKVPDGMIAVSVNGINGAVPTKVTFTILLLDGSDYQRVNDNYQNTPLENGDSIPVAT